MNLDLEFIQIHHRATLLLELTSISISLSRGSHTLALHSLYLPLPTVRASHRIERRGPSSRPALGGGQEARAGAVAYCRSSAATWPGRGRSSRSASRNRAAGARTEGASGCGRPWRARGLCRDRVRRRPVEVATVSQGGRWMSRARFQRARRPQGAGAKAAAGAPTSVAAVGGTSALVGRGASSGERHDHGWGGPRERHGRGWGSGERHSCGWGSNRRHGGLATARRADAGGEGVLATLNRPNRTDRNVIFVKSQRWGAVGNFSQLY